MSLFSFFRGPDESLLTGKKADAVQHTRGPDDVLREIVVVGEPDGDLVVTPVASAPAGAAVALPIRLGDGHNVAEGATTDAAAVSGNGTIIALLKAIRDSLKGPSTAVVTRPSVGAGSTQILAANTSRKGGIVVNEHASQDLIIKFGVGASATSYTGVAQSGGGLFNFPVPVYTGVVEAIYSGGGTQVCEVTEET